MPVTERRLDRAGVSTAVLEGGDGPPVVVLHGVGQCAATWIRGLDGFVPQIVPEGASKRSYDSARRRQRGREERSATRLRVVEAAQRLFLERGYVATTMADIAHEAGVAMQSVYNAGQSKADLLHEVTNLVVGGDDEEVLLIDRPFVAAIAAESDPVRQVRLLAAALAGILERVAPLWEAYREAAAVDIGAAEHLANAHCLRRQTFGDFIALLPEERLRRPPDESADALWAIASVDVLLLLRTLPGWDPARYADWLGSTLVMQLLTSEES